MAEQGHAQDREASRQGAAGPEGNTFEQAPAYEALPKPRCRHRRGADPTREIDVALEVVTPILGGAYETRTLDEVDFIRVPSIRGQLRFWWRALYAHESPTAKDLYERECALWGGTGGNRPRRSVVEIRVVVEHIGETDLEDVQPYRRGGKDETRGSYALWPARSDGKKGRPPAPRRRPGTRFRLFARVGGVQDLSRRDFEQVRNAIRAWVVFGGYGSRTRRGLGSLSVVEQRAEWLPAEPTRSAFQALFGRDVFESRNQLGSEVPALGGAALQVGMPTKDALDAWAGALDTLKTFRQGSDGDAGDRAREPGHGKTDPRRPSISNWPEADKIRRRFGKTQSHRPQHNSEAVWPRAGFGLPIIGQFQKNGRNGERYDEPDDFEIGWASANDSRHERLASPLIVKALPLANGSFLPCVLWLRRALPEGARAGVVKRGPGGSGESSIDPATFAPFDRLVAPGDTARFSALEGKATLREAFLDWLHLHYKTTVVAP